MAKKSYYVVRQGSKPGIYNSWEECEAQVKGVSNAEYRGFETLKDAESYLNRSVEEEKTTEEDSSIEVERFEPLVRELYSKRKTYNQIGADETGKEFYGPMVACAVYYDDEFNQNLFDEIEIIDSKELKKPDKLKKIAEKLMDPVNKLKFTIVEASGDYSNPEQAYEYDARWNYNEIYEKTKNANGIQAFMINHAIQLSIDKFGEPNYITFDKFVEDDLYYDYLKGKGKNMNGRSLADVIANSRIIENIKATPQADAIKNSPSAAAAIIAKYVRNEFFEFIDQEYPVIDQNGEPIRMPQGDNPSERNVKYGLLFIKQYELNKFKEFTKNNMNTYDKIIDSAKEEGII